MSEISTANRKYKVTITVTLPEHQKPTVVHIDVEAPNMADGVIAAQSAWYKATEPKDIAIKEL